MTSEHASRTDENTEEMSWPVSRFYCSVSSRKIKLTVYLTAN